MTKTLHKTLEIIWAAIPNKKTRKLDNVLQRHAFMKAARDLGCSTVEIAKITGFNHAMASYANRMHETNLTDPRYRQFYREIYNMEFLKGDLDKIETEIRSLFKMRDRIKREMNYIKSISLEESII